MIKFFQALFLATLLACSVSAHTADKPRVLLKTSMGDIVVEVFPDKAPKSAANFLQYVKDGHYNGTVFHRIINNFMIQGGGFDKDMKQKPTRDAISNEASNGLKNERGTLAMARTSAPHSATAQFFINVKHNDFLDYPGRDGWGYAVFGKVVKGMDVVDRIRALPTNRMDAPLQPIVIESASMTK